MNSEPPLRRRDEARALFRNAILDAAEAVFAERGFHGARIQDIAERARTAVGTVYNHFEDKDDVLGALLEKRSEEMASQLHDVPDDRGPFEARLRARVGRLEQHRERVFGGDEGVRCDTGAALARGDRPERRTACGPQAKRPHLEERGRGRR